MAAQAQLRPDYFVKEYLHHHGAYFYFGFSLAPSWCRRHLQKDYLWVKGLRVSLTSDFGYPKSMLAATTATIC